MPDEIFLNQPIEEPSPDPYILPNATNLVHDNPGENQRLDLLSGEIKHLRRQLSWSSALSITSLILAGILAGLLFGLKQQQDQQLKQMGTLTGDRVGVQTKVSLLNQQVAALNQEILAMSQQISAANQQSSQKVNQTQFKQLIAVVQDINSKAVTKDQLTSVLQRLQPRVNSSGQSTSTPLTAPSP